MKIIEAKSNKKYSLPLEVGARYNGWSFDSQVETVRLASEIEPVLLAKENNQYPEDDKEFYLIVQEGLPILIEYRVGNWEPNSNKSGWISLKYKAYSLEGIPLESLATREED